MVENKSPKPFISKTSALRCLTLSGASALLFCAGSFAPPFGVAALFFSPTPLSLLGARENLKWMTAGMTLIFVSLLLLFGPWFSLYFLLGQGLLSFGLTLPLGRVERGGEGLLFCTTVSVVSKLIFVAVTYALTGQNPLMVDTDVLRQTIANMAAGLGTQEGAAFRGSMEQVVSFVPYMLPSLILMSSMLDSFLNYKLCEALQRKQAVKFPSLPSFGEWRFPKSLLWALVFAFLLPLLAEEGNNRSLWTVLEINLKFLINVFFYLQGISLAWWWFARRKVHVLLRVLLVLLLSLPVLGMWVIALGVGDMCLDLRTAKERWKK